MATFLIIILMPIMQSTPSGVGKFEDPEIINPVGYALKEDIVIKASAHI